MIKIMITCGGGFSSSALVGHLNAETIEKNLTDRAEFIYCPYDFGGIGGDVDKVDIVMLCPHLAFQSKELAKKYPHKPFYIIPTRLYGLMAAEEFIEDAEDCIEGWKKTGMNPFHFEGEDNPLRITRTISHRKWLQEK
ncbi:MAG: hypothetical protein IJ130_13090 [Solobacterium sp.]|nr:hypothetical protein [Solobacterium sp.]